MSFTTNKDNDLLNAMLEHANATERSAYRSAGFGDEDDGLVSGTSARPTKTTSQSTDQEASRGVWNIGDKTFLDQHIMLYDNVHPEVVFDHLLDEIKDLSGGFKNYREFYEEKKIIGFHFDETRQGLYRVELFEFQQQLGVNCTRLDGDGFAITGLWEQLKNSLIRSNFALGDSDMGETDDEDFLSFSDDEEFSDDFDPASFKYLDLSRDPTFVNRLVSDIEDINLGTHSLLLLAFNLLSPNNLEFLTEKFAQEIFDAIVLRLSKPFGVDLPVARCAARVLKSLVKADSVQASVKQMRTILDAGLIWSSEDAPRKSVIPTASEEAAVILTSLYEDFTQSVSDSDSDELNQQVKDLYENIDLENIEFDSVKELLAPFVATN